MPSTLNRKLLPELKELLVKDEFSWKIRVEDFLSGIIFPPYQCLDCDGSGRSHLFVGINPVARNVPTNKF